MKKAILVLIVMAIPVSSYAAGTYSCLLSTGFTPSSYNGEYTWIDNNGGSLNGSMIERYGNGSRYIYTHNATYSIMLGTTLGSTSGIEFYNNGLTHPNEVVSDIINGTWVELVGGYVPGSFEECPPPEPTPTPTTTPTVFTATSSNPFIFMITSNFLFLMQLMAFLLVIYIVLLIVGWPIRRLAYRLKQLIKRGSPR